MTAEQWERAIEWFALAPATEGRHVSTERDEADDRLIERAKTDREFAAYASPGECDREADRYHDERGAVKGYVFTFAWALAPLIIAVYWARVGKWEYVLLDILFGVLGLAIAFLEREVDTLTTQLRAEKVRARLNRAIADEWMRRYTFADRENQS